MASPQLRSKTRVVIPRDWSSESSALRLLSAEGQRLAPAGSRIVKILTFHRI